MLGSRVWIDFGNSKIFPNMYILIIGGAGSRKSTAIKFAAQMLSATGYRHLAADSTSREQFFEDFSAQCPEQEALEYGLLDNPDITKIVTEYCVIADEFIDFAGANNIGMYASLGNLWDYRGTFKYRPKHGKKVEIINPILNLLAGTTADIFASAFPATTINQGLPSRTVIVNSLGRRKRIFWPEPSSVEAKDKFVSELKKIQELSGPCNVDAGAKAILKDIYENWQTLPDSRFSTYGSRRYTQLLKLCIIVAASYMTTHISKQIVIEANSILTFAEKYMPDALGEFGLAKASFSSSRILDIIKFAPEGIISLDTLYGHVASDVKDFKEMQDLVMNLYQAKKIEVSGKGISYKRKSSIVGKNEYLHCRFDMLWENEREAGV